MAKRGLTEADPQLRSKNIYFLILTNFNHEKSLFENLIFLPSVEENILGSSETSQLY